MNHEQALQIAVDSLVKQGAIVEEKHKHFKRIGFRTPEETAKDIDWKSSLSTGASQLIELRAVEIEIGRPLLTQGMFGDSAMAGFLRKVVRIKPHFWTTAFLNCEAAMISPVSSLAIFELHRAGQAKMYTDDEHASYYFDLPNQCGNPNEPSDAYIRAWEAKCAELQDKIDNGQLDLSTIIEEKQVKHGTAYGLNGMFVARYHRA